MKHRIRRRYLYYLLRTASFISLLFPIKINKFLGRRMGEFAFFLVPGHRKSAIENLRIAFKGEKTEAEIRAVARGVFRNLGENLFEILSAPKLTPRNIDRHVRIKGLGIVDKALSQKRGFIVLSAHLGNWELLAGWFGLKKYPVNVLARRLRYVKFDNWMNGLRRKMDVNVVMRDESAKTMLRLLRGGQSIAILADQDISSLDGVFVDFFGRPAYTPTAPVILALATAVPIIPMFIVREGNSHTIYVEEPLELEITGNKENDIKINTEKWSKVVESYIRKYPSQWVWMHNRWKTNPQTAKGFVPNEMKGPK
ncbi:MAG: lysophospholipid acyltransferase family protein [Candidatus Omnitrophica bacterium]|nr:lysophospholipid acyltransferase family protein [Candidatus Omnitrophota bacterium]